MISKINQKLYPNGWWLLTIAAYVLIYIQALTPVYVEGDDSQSIAYHVLKRAPDIQPAYAPYHGMMDRLLSLLPPNEPLLRYTGIYLSSIATTVMVILMLQLVFQWLPDLRPSHKLLITFTFLLASPELYYLGLIYSPVSIGMCLVLGSHLLIRNRTKPADVLVSALLFGLGVAFRWTIVPYGLIVVTDLALLQRTGPLLRKLRPGVIWGALALLATVVSITISGYGPANLLKTVGIAGGVFSGRYRPYITSFVLYILVTAATLLPLLSPGMCLLILAGLWQLIQRKEPLLLIVLVSFLGAAPWISSGTPKFIIIALPAILYCAATGVMAIWRYSPSNSSRPLLLSGMAILLLLPWLVGIHMTRSFSTFGPGFEVRPYDHADTPEIPPTFVFDGGAALPTFEGPRPLFGHGYVLLGGEWRDMAQDMADESKEIVDQAILLDAPILVQNWSPGTFIDELAAAGYTTTDPYDRIGEAGSYFVERRFFNDDGDEVILLVHEFGGTREDLLQIASLSSDKVIIIGYPGEMRSSYFIAPDAFERRLGTYSAIVDIARLRTALDR